MRLYFVYQGVESVFDVTNEQYVELRKKMAIRFAVLQKLKLPIPDYVLANMGAPKKLLAKQGIMVPKDSTPTTTISSVIKSL